MKFKHYITLSLIIFIMGCAQKYQWKATAIEEHFTNDLFTASIIPMCDSTECKNFILNIENKSNSNIEINWNKTLFIKNNQTSGGFMSAWIPDPDRQNKKPLGNIYFPEKDVIFPEEKFSRIIYPINLVFYFSTDIEIGWERDGPRRGNMPEGVNGIYLTVNAGGKEFREKLTVIVSKKLIKN